VTLWPLPVCRAGRPVENDGQNCFVLQPSTFINRSDQSVAALAGYYRIPAASILVVYD
jgi:peptidyl-tRNA hydrolase, PTH1 family